MYVKITSGAYEEYFIKTRTKEWRANFFSHYSILIEERAGKVSPFDLE